MNDLEKILNSNQSYIYYVTKEFYDELEKEKPNIYVWIGDEATNTICFTGEKTYSKYLKTAKNTAQNRFFIIKSI